MVKIGAPKVLTWFYRGSRELVPGRRDAGSILYVDYVNVWP